MALYGVVHHFPGGTKHQYEASVAAVHPGAGQLPDGQILHVAGASPSGWTVLAVHESQESREKFRDEILMPRMQAGIEGGSRRRRRRPPSTWTRCFREVPQAGVEPATFRLGGGCSIR